MLVDVRHKLLSAHTPNVVTMGFLAATNYVTFAKDISHPEAHKVDSVARSFLEFALLLYSSLAPAYGLIDETGSNMPTSADTAAKRITHIFWANFYGRPYVEAYGGEFLLGVPGWRTETLSDGGVVHVVSPSFVNRWKIVKAQQARDYLRTKAPDVRIYRPYKNEFLT